MLCSVSSISAKERIATPSGIPFDELQDRVDKYVSKYIGTSTAGANVLIVKDGDIILNSSYGYADVDNQKKVTSDTVFEWGSVTKLLVWTSVMQLVEQGKLELDEDIRAYLPDEFLTKLRFDTPITMLHLMHHNAGWEEKFTDLFYLSGEKEKSLEEMLHITEPYQVHKPGDIVAYSNFGVALAGFIVEQIESQPFYEYVNEHIFSVLEMEDTTIHPTQADNLDVAMKREAIYGYTVNSGEFSISKNERNFIGLYPAGSAIGTIDDAAKFMFALMPADGENSPLFQHNRTLDEMLTTSDFYDDEFPRNAHGFWEGLYTVNVLEHAGNTDSFSSNFTFSKDERLGVIVMTNQMGESEVSYGLPTLLYGEYSTQDDLNKLPNTKDLEGSYSMARQPYKGFTKLYGALNIGNIKSTDPNKFNAYGMTFEQISPYLYKTTNKYNMHFHVTLNDDGSVEKISMPTSDILPISPSIKFFNTISIIAIAFSFLYTIIALLIMVIYALKNRKKAVRFSVMKKWETLLLLLNLVPVINLIVLFYRTLNYASYSALRVHFWVNYAYILVVIICIIALFVQWKKSLPTRGQKIGYVLSCVSALLVIALIFGWELYY